MSRETLRRAWETLVAAGATLAAIEVPARLVLHHPAPVLDARIDHAIMLLFVADLLLESRRVVDAARRGTGLSLQLLRWLIADLLPALPFALLGGSGWLRVLRLAKLFRILRYMHEAHQRHPHRWNLLRLAFFVYWLSLLVHWLSCLWLAIRPVPPGTAWTSAYLRALYLCIQTVTTVGYGDITPQTDREVLCVMVLMLVGVATYGYLIGNVASLLTSIDPAKAHHLENMERLNAFMSYRRVPPELQRRIRDYHAHLWGQRLGYDETTVLAGLPPGLLTDVSLFLKRDIIHKVPFFKDAGDEMVRAIALAMRPVVYMPGDLIFRAGEQGLDMYFIAQGAVEVLGADGTVLNRLHAGDFFGEVALLQRGTRTATVRALDYCDLYALDDASFQQVLQRFPDFAAHVRAMAEERGQRR